MPKPGYEPITAEELDRLGQAMREALRPFVEGLQRLASDVNHAFGIDPAPADPKERALWLKERRNTGPAKTINRRNRKG